MTQLEDLRIQVEKIKRGLDLYYLSQSVALSRLHNTLGDQLFNDQHFQRETFSEVDIQTLIPDTIEPPIFVKGEPSGLYTIVGIESSAQE